MKRIRLTKLGKITACASAFIVLIGTLVLVDGSIKKEESESVDQDYVNKIVINEDIPVVNSTNLIVRPYIDNNVKVLRNFYNYQGTEEEQIGSIIYYESTYMPNYAIAYGGVEKFEIISILDGTIESIKEDGLLGKIIEIKHENDLISVYQSISDITVEEGQVVKQGEVIASSGKSNLNKDLNNHLLFELLHKSQIVNPEEYYNKDITQL